MGRKAQLRDSPPPFPQEIPTTNLLLDFPFLFFCVTHPIRSGPPFLPPPPLQKVFWISTFPNSKSDFRVFGRMKTPAGHEKAPPASPRLLPLSVFPFLPTGNELRCYCLHWGTRRGSFPSRLLALSPFRVERRKSESGFREKRGTRAIIVPPFFLSEPFSLMFFSSQGSISHFQGFFLPSIGRAACPPPSVTKASCSRISIHPNLSLFSSIFL